MIISGPGGHPHLPLPAQPQPPQHPPRPQTGAPARGQPAYQPGTDAQALWDATEGGWFGWGTDKDAIARVLQGKTQEQIAALSQTFKDHYGRDLEAVLCDELRGDEEARAMALLKGKDYRIEADAVVLRDELNDTFVDEQRVLKLIERYDPAQRQALAAAYAGEHDGRPEDVLLTDCEDAFDDKEMQRARDLLAPEDGDRAAGDARAAAARLKLAVDGAGTDEDTLVAVLSGKKAVQIRAIEAAYEEAYDQSLRTRLKDELTGWFEGEGDYQQVMQLLDAPQPDEGKASAAWQAEAGAHRIQKAVEGVGTDEDALRRELQGKNREQIDAIDQAFRKHYGEGLKDRIGQDFEHDWGGGADHDELKLMLDAPAKGAETPQRQHQLDAAALHRALDGPGTDEDLVRQVLDGKSGQDIEGITAAYRDAGYGNLRRDLDSDLDGRDELELVRQSYDRGAIDFQADPRAAIAEQLRRVRERQAYEDGGRPGFWTVAAGVVAPSTLALRAAGVDPIDAGQKLWHGDAGFETDGERLERTLARAEQYLKDGDLENAARYAGFSERDIETLVQTKDQASELVSTGAAITAATVVTVATAGSASPLMVAALSGAAAGTASGVTYGTLNPQAGHSEIVRQVSISAAVGATGGVPIGRAGHLAFTFSDDAASLAARRSALSSLRGSTVEGAWVGGQNGFVDGTLRSATESATWRDGLGAGMRRVFAHGGIGTAGGMLLGAGLGSGIYSLAGLASRWVGTTARGSAEHMPGTTSPEPDGPQVPLAQDDPARRLDEQADAGRDVATKPPFGSTHPPAPEPGMGGDAMKNPVPRILPESPDPTSIGGSATAPRFSVQTDESSGTQLMVHHPDGGEEVISSLESPWVGRRIGRGSYGSVYLVGDDHVLKVLDSYRFAGGVAGARQAARAEADLHRQLAQDGLPYVIRQDGPFDVDGQPALLMKLYPASSKDDFQISHGMARGLAPTMPRDPPAAVGLTYQEWLDILDRLPNGRTVIQLKRAQDWFETQQIRAGDPQFLLADDGSIALADLLSLRPAPRGTDEWAQLQFDWETRIEPFVVKGRLNAEVAAAARARQRLDAGQQTAATRGYGFVIGDAPDEVLLANGFTPYTEGGTRVHRTVEGAKWQLVDSSRSVPSRADGGWLYTVQAHGQDRTSWTDVLGWVKLDRNGYVVEPFQRNPDAPDSLTTPRRPRGPASAAPTGSGPDVAEPARYADRFLGFSRACAADGLPLYAALSKAVADDPALLALQRGAPVGSTAPKFLSAVHWVLSRHPSDELARYFPTLRGDLHATLSLERSSPELRLHFRRFCLEHQDEILAVQRRYGLQANSVNRSAPLVAMLSHATGPGNEPIGLIDLGTSAGLNLLLDRFAYDFGAGRLLGPAHARVRLATQIHGEGELARPVALPPIGERLGIDLAPVRLSDDEQLSWVRASIWPEKQLERARFDAAVAEGRIAWQERGPTLLSGDMLERLPAAVNLVRSHGHQPALMASYSLGYLPPQGKAALPRLLAELSRDGPLTLTFLDNYETLNAVAGRRFLSQDTEHGGVLGVIRAEEGRVSITVFGSADPAGEWVRLYPTPKMIEPER